MNESESGHRTLPHTADLRIEAWGPTREDCIAEAVLGTVESFLDTASAHPRRTHQRRFTADCDEDLLVAILEELIFVVDTAAAAPVDVEIEPVDGAVDVRFELVAAKSLQQVGAVPKGVSLHGLSFAQGPEGWRCSVTLDV